MENFKEILREVGFSDELIDAINKTPQMGGQEIDIDNTHYLTYENDIISSTEISMSDNTNTFNYYGNESEKSITS